MSALNLKIIWLIITQQTNYTPPSRPPKRPHPTSECSSNESNKENLLRSSGTKRRRKYDKAVGLLEDAVSMSKKAISMSEEAISLSQSAITLSTEAAGILAEKIE